MNVEIVNVSVYYLYSRTLRETSKYFKRMATLSIEEENCIRMFFLTQSIALKAVRTYFDQKFAPCQLESTLRNNLAKINSLVNNRILSVSQMNVLFPRKGKIKYQLFKTMETCTCRSPI